MPPLLPWLPLSLVVSAAALSCSPSSNPAYACTTAPIPGLTAYFSVNSKGTELAVRMEYSSADAWLGFAASTTGRMANSDAVIAEPAGGGVTRYLLSSSGIKGVGGVQDLSGTSVSASNGGGVVAEFTRKIAATGSGGISISSGNNLFLFAVGNGATFDGSIHARQSSDPLSLASIWPGGAAPAPSPATGPSPATSSSTDEGDDDGEGGGGENSSNGASSSSSGDDGGKSSSGDSEGESSSSSSPSGSSPSGGASASCTSTTGSAGVTRTVALSNNVEMSWLLDSAASTIAVELIYSGNAWVAWGPTSTGGMRGGDVVVGLPNDGVYEYALNGYSVGSCQRYSQQELSNTSVTQNNGKTTVSFTRPLSPAASGKISIAGPGSLNSIFAYGMSNSWGPHALSAAGKAAMSLDSCSVSTSSSSGSTNTLRYTHGWIMSISFGFLLPLGAIVGRFGKRFEKSWWFPAHRLLQVFGLLGGLAGIGTAYYMVDRDYGSGNHFNTNHSVYGAAIGGLVLFQVLLALARPKKAAAAAATTTTATTGQRDPYAAMAAPSSTVGSISRHPTPVASAARQKPPKESFSRIAWEWLHFGVGWGVVVWAVFEVFSGLRLLEGTVSTNHKLGYAAAVVILAILAAGLQAASFVTGCGHRSQANGSGNGQTVMRVPVTPGDEAQEMQEVQL